MLCKTFQNFTNFQLLKLIMNKLILNFKSKDKKKIKTQKIF